MNTSNAREQRANEEIDIELEYERVRKQRYEDFQEWLNKCPLVVTDYQDYTTEFVITFNLEADYWHIVTFVVTLMTHIF